MKPLFSFDTSFLSNSQYILSWSAIEVDLPTRKFVKQLCEAKSFNTVYNSSRQQKLKYLSQREQINWTLTKNLLASANADGSTSRIASADKAFQVKCFTEELPLLLNCNEDVLISILLNGNAARVAMLKKHTPMCGYVQIDVTNSLSVFN